MDVLCIEKLKTQMLIIIIKVGLRERPFTMLPCSCPNISLDFLGREEVPTQVETRKEVGSFLPRQHTPFTGLLDIVGWGVWIQ